MSTSPERVAKRGGARTPSRDLRSALIDAAQVVLVRDGAGAVTVRAVATEAGVAPMGAHNRFGSKEGLIEALLMRSFEGLRQAVAVRDEFDPVRRLRGSGIRYREFALANQELYAAMFGGSLAVVDPSEDLQRCASGAFQELVEAVATGMAAGRLLPGDPKDVAQQLWSAVHGAVILEMTHNVFTADPEVTYLALLDLIMRGLVAPGPSA